MRLSRKLKYRNKSRPFQIGNLSFIDNRIKKLLKPAGKQGGLLRQNPEIKSGFVKKSAAV